MINSDTEFDTSITSDTLNILNTKSYTHEHKKLLVKRINEIKSKRCYVKIFKIIYNDNHKYSQNDNGVFFNLTNLPDTTLSKIEQVIQYYDNKKNMELQLMKNHFTEDSASDY